MAGWRAAEAREIAERRHKGPMSSEDAWTFALEVWELNPGAFETPDPAREREATNARAAWTKLRERLGWRAASDRRS